MNILQWWRDRKAKKAAEKADVEATRMKEKREHELYVRNLILEKVDEYYNEWYNIVKSHNNGSLSNELIRYYNMSLHIRMFAAVEYNLKRWCKHQAYVPLIDYSRGGERNQLLFKKVEKYINIGGQLGKDVCQQEYDDWYKSVNIADCPLTHLLNKLRRGVSSWSDTRKGLDFIAIKWETRYISGYINQKITEGAMLLERKL